MFNIDEYRKFVQSKQLKSFRSKYNYLDSLCQFGQSPSVYLGIASSIFSSHVKRNFYMENKPDGVWMNNWYLHLFGYKYCPECRKISSLDNFDYSEQRWDKRVGNCKQCRIFLRTIFNPPEMFKKHREKYPEKIAYKSAMRRAQRKQATPEWLTKEQRAEILLIYKNCRQISKDTGIEHHVDHIVPLTHDKVSGLHVPWNLRIISKEENLRKNNKFEVI